MDVEAGMGGHGNGAEVELRVEVRWGESEVGGQVGPGCGSLAQAYGSKD